MIGLILVGGCKVGVGWIMLDYYWVNVNLIYFIWYFFERLFVYVKCYIEKLI